MACLNKVFMSCTKRRVLHWTGAIGGGTHQVTQIPWASFHSWAPSAFRHSSLELLHWVLEKLRGLLVQVKLAVLMPLLHQTIPSTAYLKVFEQLVDILAGKGLRNTDVSLHHICRFKTVLYYQRYSFIVSEKHTCISLLQVVKYCILVIMKVRWIWVMYMCMRVNKFHSNNWYSTIHVHVYKAETAKW